MTEIHSLPFDILLYIMSLVDDRKSLYDCSRVNQVFYEAALPSLYRSISLVVLRSNGSENLNYPPLETLDRKHHLRPYVKSVELCFGLNDYVRYRPNQRPSPVWAESLSKLPNIQSFTFYHPEHRYHPLPHDISDIIISALTGCSSIFQLTLLARINAADIARFSRLTNLREIRIGLLTTCVYDALGAWMTGSSCQSLSMMDTYSLETPAQITPYIHNLHSLHIGRNHGLSNRDLLHLLSASPSLRSLDISFDHFLSVTLASPQKITFHGLTHLERLVVRHQGVSSRSQFNEVFDWIALVITESPLLSSLSLSSDDGKECNFPSTPPKLLSLLIKIPELEVLDLPFVVMRQAALKTILTRIPKLRVLSVFLIDDRVLDIRSDKRDAGYQLDAIYLRSNRPTCPYSSLPPMMRKMMSSFRGSPGYLRRVTSSRQGWQALWTTGQHTNRKGLNLLKDEYPDVYSDILGWH
ncbi:hypothetical protein VNI00_009863 [Paramarasmius palmivorus]|uniref:F-box domain-containing protein n=1 Tax=Paramarasmius palmivorus TaxID=297713 RepID=A0AAW0CMY1_9AGAR